MRRQIEAPMILEHMVRALELGECSSEELTEECLRRMARIEPTVGAFLTVDEEGALAAARESDRRRRNGAALHPMDGIPYAVKDNFCTRGLRTTCASEMLANYVPPYDAEVISRLRGAGCVLLGKLNMDEFAMGSSTQHSALGVTRNPLDPERVPGGSSGGTAAAVAAGELPFAVGSDTGGSVRQPASFCGVMGFKPTYGVISRRGMAAFASSLDCVGFAANTAVDSAMVLELLAGKDPLDATSLAHPDPAFLKSCRAGVKGLRVAVVPDAGVGSIPVSVANSVRMAVERLSEAGALIGETTLPSPEQALLSYCAVSAVEAASNLARYDGIRYGSSLSEGSTPEERIAATRGRFFGEEVKRRILLGTAILTGDLRERYYVPACRIREQIRCSLERSFETYDLILKPTTPCGAFRMDEPISDLQMREMDLCTVYASLAGIPAISVPVGNDENGMPLGIQLMAAPMREDLVLRAAKVLGREDLRVC